MFLFNYAPAHTFFNKEKILNIKGKTKGKGVQNITLQTTRKMIVCTFPTHLLKKFQKHKQEVNSTKYYNQQKKIPC